MALVRPDGVKIDSTRKDPTAKWFVGKDYALATIQEPAVGDWHVETAGQRPMKVVVITDVRLEVALDQETYDAGQEVQIAARLVAAAHTGLVSPPLSELAFMAAVVPLEAAEGTTLLLSHQDGQLATPAVGQWYRATYTPLTAPGEYCGRVIAAAPTFSREKSFAFRVLVPQVALAPPGTSQGGAAAPYISGVDESSPAPGETPDSDDSPQDMAPASAEPSPWSDALGKLAMAHGFLLALGAAAFLGRRLMRGGWRARQEGRAGEGVRP